MRDLSEPLASVCALLPVLAASAGHAVSAAAGQGDAASCAALAGQHHRAPTP